jgi:hypothetical protein
MFNAEGGGGQDGTSGIVRRTSVAMGSAAVVAAVGQNTLAHWLINPATRALHHAFGFALDSGVVVGSAAA